MKLFSKNGNLSSLLKNGFFEIYNKIILRIVDVKDEQLFLKYIAKSDYTRISYYNSFYYMCAMNYANNGSKFLYIKLNEWLLTFELYNDIIGIKNSPINLNGDYSEMSKIYKICFSILKKMKSIFGFDCIEIYNMTKHDFVYFDKQKINKYENNYKEFIFRCDDLINLEGSKYKTRRRIVKRFYDTYPNFIMRKYNPITDKKDAIRIYEKWIKDYKNRIGSEITDYNMAKAILDVVYERTKHYNIFIGIIENRIVGFIVITPHCDNCKCVLSEYTDINIKGLAETMWYNGLKMTTHFGEYENDGTGGSESDGLYRYKDSHHPIDFYEACTFVYK